MPDNARLWRFSWRWLPGRDAAKDSKLLRTCAELYSNEYARWGSNGPRPDEPVHIAPDHLQHLLDNEEAWLACALFDQRVVGYCAALQFNLSSAGPVAWVTQLVVEKTFRNLGLATNLLYSIWQFSDCHAWGLVTANPYAVRALETATRRPCRAGVIRREGSEVLAALGRRLDYLPSAFVTDSKGQTQPRVDTQFFIDHNEIGTMRRNARRHDRPWNLGEVSEGEEWFACTFAGQRPDSLNERRLAQLLTGADSIWIEAYEGMMLDADHQWHRHTKAEVDYIVGRLALPSGADILDVGCGDGRHAYECSGRGYNVTGVDLVSALGSRSDGHGGRGPTFVTGDARKGLPSGSFDLALCLYDVLGSSANAEDDRAILRNMQGVLAPGGYAVISVMNCEAVLPYMDASHRPGGVGDFVEALEKLSPSDTMESSGDVFDPNLLVHYDGVFYRKEQFSRATWKLPTELVVRDRRFTAEELAEMFKRTGFNLQELSPVQASHWDRAPTLVATDKRAKELLAIAQKK